MGWKHRFLNSIITNYFFRLLILDINAPRDEIEEANTSEEEILANMLNDREDFTSTGLNKIHQCMVHLDLIEFYHLSN